MSDFSEIGKIPETIFSGMPTEKLAPTDPTSITDEVKPTNAYKRNLIGGTKSVLKAIPDMKYMKNISDQTVSAVKSFGEKTQISGLFSKLPGITQTVKRNLLNGNTIYNLQNAKSPMDYVTIAGNVFEVAPENMEMVGALEDVYKIVSDKNFFDKLSANLQDGMIAIGIDIAGSYGYGPLAELLVDRLKEEKQKRKAWSQVFYSYTPSSDLDVMLKAIQEGGLANLYALTNDPIGYVLSTFRFDLGKYKTVTANTTNLIELLDTIDPQWLKYNRGEEVVYKLDHLKRLSQDAITAFDAIDEIRPIARGAMVIGHKRSREVMKQTYPILNNLM